MAVGGDLAGREDAEGFLVVVKRQANLLEVVPALAGTGRLAGLLYRREQNGNEDGDDGNHHQQFNEGKTPLPETHVRHLSIQSCNDPAATR